MLSKLLSLIKMFLYKIKYRDKLSFAGIPSFVRKRKQINIQDGKMIVGKGFSPKSEAYFAVVCGGTLTIGDQVYINKNSMIVCHDSITIGNHCIIGPNVLIYDHDHRFGASGITDGYKTAPVSIGDNCWVGANVVILRGTQVGEGCIIGAGTVLKGTIPPHSLVTSVGIRELSVAPIVDRI